MSIGLYYGLILSKNSLQQCRNFTYSKLQLHPSLAAFRARLDGALSLVQQARQGGWNDIIFKVLSNPNHSVILRLQTCSIKSPSAIIFLRKEHKRPQCNPWSTLFYVDTSILCTHRPPPTVPTEQILKKRCSFRNSSERGDNERHFAVLIP